MNEMLIYICVLRKYISIPVDKARVLYNMSKPNWFVGRLKLKFYEGDREHVRYADRVLAQTAINLYQVDIKEPANS